MKLNHESIRDNKSYDDNMFSSPTPLEEKPIKKEKVKNPKLPKRKWRFDVHQRFYVFHLFVPILMAIAGVLSNNPIMYISIVPYVLMVLFMRRMGGSLSGKGLDYVLWNLSVLVSTYTNSEMPNLRLKRSLLLWGGVGLTITSSFFSPWFLIVGAMITGVGMVFSFADKEPEKITSVSRILSISLLITGSIGLFITQDLALATLFLSILFHVLYEKWDDYVFFLDID